MKKVMSNEEEKKVSRLVRVASWFEDYFLGILLLIVLPVLMVLGIVFFAIPWKGQEVTYTFSDNQEYIVEERVLHLMFFDKMNVDFHDEFYSANGEWYVRTNSGCVPSYKKVEIVEEE